VDAFRPDNQRKAPRHRRNHALAPVEFISVGYGRTQKSKTAYQTAAKACGVSLNDDCKMS
jgi:hypothetical protein